MFIVNQHPLFVDIPIAGSSPRDCPPARIFCDKMQALKVFSRLIVMHGTAVYHSEVAKFFATLT